MPDELGLARGAYGVVTLHRPSNVDDEAQLRRLADALIAIQPRLPIVFPVHPRTAARLAAAGLDGALEQAGVRLIEPMPYIRFMSLVLGAGAVITDSGGLAGRDDLSRHPLLHPARQYRAADHDRGGDERAGDAGDPARPDRGLAGGRAAARRGVRNIGTAARRRAASRTCGAARPPDERHHPVAGPAPRLARPAGGGARRGGGDVVVDLSERGAAAGAARLLRPLYDGSPDSRFLLGRLQRRECPYLEIVDETGRDACRLLCGDRGQRRSCARRRPGLRPGRGAAAARSGRPGEPDPAAARTAAGPLQPAAGAQGRRPAARRPAAVAFPQPESAPRPLERRAAPGRGRA